MSAAALAFTDFVQGLQDSGALEPHQLRELSEQAQLGPADPRVLGSELLRRGWMTAYQINQVNRGQAGRLVLGPYLLLERLGKGGMGEVLKARHRRMGRLVALKLVRGDRRDRHRVARFQREAEAAARLDHPNIVYSYDAGVLGESLFLAMEYLEGSDLKRLVRRDGPLSAAAACDCVRQAALGLQHACERGVIHRDLKPSNLFRTARGQVVKVLDLGLARLDDAAAGLTRAGMTVGTAAYVAPELFGDPTAADERSDLYSLGCTLYYLLVGHPPFCEGSSVRKMMAHLAEPPPPIESLRPDLPADLVGVVGRLLAKHPEDRFQTPAELALVLEDLLGRGVVDEGGKSPWPQTNTGLDSSTTSGG